VFGHSVRRIFRLTLQARSDAPLSLSKSCSDKLTIYQCISLLRGVTTLLISPQNAYLTMLVLPKLQHVSEATTRAFRPEGRLSTLKKETIDGWSGGFQYKPFQIRTTTAEFDFSRTKDRRRMMFIPCSKSGVWYPYAQEVISSGVLQGRKVTDPRGASEISRRKMWQAVMHVLQILGHSDSKDDIHIHSDYRSLKADEQLLSRRIVKVDVTAALQGWRPNDGDDLFTLG
jgi:tRNA-specific adenosine deaminase 1